VDTKLAFRAAAKTERGFGSNDCTPDQSATAPTFSAAPASVCRTSQSSYANALSPHKMWLVAFKAAAGCPVSRDESRNNAAVVAVLVTAEVTKVRESQLEVVTSRNHAPAVPGRADSGSERL